MITAPKYGEWIVMIEQMDFNDQEGKKSQRK